MTAIMRNVLGEIAATGRSLTDTGVDRRLFRGQTIEALIRAGHLIQVDDDNTTHVQIFSAAGYWLPLAHSATHVEIYDLRTGEIVKVFTDRGALKRATVWIDETAQVELLTAGFTPNDRGGYSARDGIDITRDADGTLWGHGITGDPQHYGSHVRPGIFSGQATFGHALYYVERYRADVAARRETAHAEALTAETARVANAEGIAIGDLVRGTSVSTGDEITGVVVDEYPSEFRPSHYQLADLNGGSDSFVTAPTVITEAVIGVFNTLDALAPIGPGSTIYIAGELHPIADVLPGKIGPYAPGRICQAVTDAGYRPAGNYFRALVPGGRIRLLPVDEKPTPEQIIAEHFPILAEATAAVIAAYRMAEAGHDGDALDGAESVSMQSQPEQQHAARDDRGPVLVRSSVEANPTSETVEIPRAEWDAMTPAERRQRMDEIGAETMNNAGGYGASLVDPDLDADLIDPPSDTTKINTPDSAASTPPGQTADCTHGADCTVHPGVNQVHNFDALDTARLVDTLREAIAEQQRALKHLPTLLKPLPGSITPPLDVAEAFASIAAAAEQLAEQLGVKDHRA